VGGLEKIDVIFTFGQNEYTRAVRQYLLAGNIVRKRDFFILPLIFIVLLPALFYSSFNRWVLLLTLLCLGAVLLICFLFFFKPKYDYAKKPHLRKETRLTFTEEGITWLEAGRPSPAEEHGGPVMAGAPEHLVFSAGGATSPEALKNPAHAAAPEEQPQEKELASTVSPAPSMASAEQKKAELKRANGNLLKSRKKNPSYIGWNMIAEVWENREFFFLIRQPHIYYIVPRHSFASQEEMQYFLRMLYRRVGIVEIVSPYPLVR
jgi:hypothetical protein